MITYSGVHIQKDGGQCGTPTTIDIAVHAGRICRFGGAVWYPLLPHLVFVGLLAYRRSGRYADLLWGFLHDAHEIATSDVPRPFKCDCMRDEQKLLDARIMPMFGLTPGMIDFHLIEQCDLDACDIEAIELGLPGFEAIATEYSVDYKGRVGGIHRSYDDTKLLRQILASPFHKDTISGHLALGVWHFNEMLAEAERGDIDAAMDRVKRWLANFDRLGGFTEVASAG